MKTSVAGLHANKKIVKTLPSIPSGSFKNWESETFRLLGKYESDVAHRLPRGELTSRVFDRLTRITIRDIEHLTRLIPRVVRQALVDFGREQSRDSERFVYDYAFDLPAAPTKNSSEVFMEHQEILLGDDSPLDDFEKAIIRVTLENPDRFIHRHGQLAQSALAGHFNVTQVAIHYRWLSIVQKAASLQAPPDLSI